MRVRQIWNDQRGSQLVEYVLVFPLIWMLLVFAVDTFTILYNKQVVLAAAFEAGRIASVQPKIGLARYHAEERASDGLKQAIGLTSSSVKIVIPKRWHKGEHLEARVSVTFSLLGSRSPYELTESYFMMVENAGDD